ncbi:hypothetical protein Trydic_g9290 [Trypoxylus dichotomus]
MNHSLLVILFPPSLHSYRTTRKLTSPSVHNTLQDEIFICRNPSNSVFRGWQFALVVFRISSVITRSLSVSSLKKYPENAVIG